MSGAAILAALYLRGAPRQGETPRRAWPQIVDALRQSPGKAGAGVLRAAGYWSEAQTLSQPGLLDWAAEQVAAGRVLTPLDAGYPRRWGVSLGNAAPPALWRIGPVPSGSWAAVVGSRSLGREAASFAREAGASLVAEGSCLVSGGAAGADRQAALGALRAGAGIRVVEILPFGLSQQAAPKGVTRLSVCAPGAPFETAAAMERNALIYASAERALAIAPRLGRGGTWHGAADALRRRLCPVWVAGGSGASALRALGARPADSPSDWLADDAPAMGDPSLFGAGPSLRLREAA